jgi:hypothetical protein
MSFIGNIFSPPKPPAAPDYAGAAEAQGAANVETARLEGRMNRPDVYSPYDITQVTDLGGDRFRQDYTLRPEYEAQRQKQVGITDKYLDTAGNYLSGLPQDAFSLANLSAQPGLIDRSNFAAIPTMGNIDDYATRVETAYYNRALNRIQPQQQQEIVDLQTRLINAGIPEGTVAYNNALSELRLVHQDALRDLAQQSIREGQALADAQLGRATGLRSFQTSDALSGVAERERIRDRQVSDYLLGRTQPLAEIATLAGQAPPPPAVATTGLDVPATSIAPPPIFAAAQQQGAYDTNVYGSNIAGYGAKMKAIGDIGATVGPALVASDIRLKKNIKYKSKSKSGLNIYEYEYNWSPQRYTGVVAQEVKKVKPSAVSENIFGHMMVDYSQLDVSMERV